MICWKTLLSAWLLCSTVSGNGLRKNGRELKNTNYEFTFDFDIYCDGDATRACKSNEENGVEKFLKKAVEASALEERKKHIPETKNMKVKLKLGTYVDGAVPNRRKLPGGWPTGGGSGGGGGNPPDSGDRRLVGENSFERGSAAQEVDDAVSETVTKELQEMVDESNGMCLNGKCEFHIHFDNLVS